MLVDQLTADNLAVAVRIASLPEKVRGYGHVRHAHAETAAKERDALLEQWRQAGVPQQAAAQAA
jgi:indolepyruvate ferredoxin oxidoreductase